MIACILGHFLSSVEGFSFIFVVVVVRTIYAFEVHWLGFAVLQVVIACA
jgi:hypothetical protein